MNTKVIVIGFAILIVTIIVLVIRCNTSNFKDIIDKEKVTKGCNKVEEFNKIRNLLESGVYKFTSKNKNNKNKDIETFTGWLFISSNNTKLLKNKICIYDDKTKRTLLSQAYMYNDLSYDRKTHDENYSLVASREGYIEYVDDNKIIIKFTGFLSHNKTKHKLSTVKYIKTKTGFIHYIYDDNGNLIREEIHTKI